MAVPTISAVVPSSGHSGGRTLVEVEGTGFALPPAAAPTGPTTAPGPSVRVLFGGVAASNVMVVSSSLLYCQTPRGTPGAAVDVQVENLDVDGNVVAGEEVVEVGAWTFVRPDLTQESELARVMRALIDELDRQIVPNVHFSTHVDYDGDDAINYAYVADTPALLLANLEVPESREHAVQDEQEVSADTGFFIVRRPPVAVDLSMTLVGVASGQGAAVVALNLMQAVRMFFKKNPNLVVDRSASDPSLGSVEYELDFSFGGPVNVTHASDNSTVESFSGSIVIRGVLLEDMPGMPTEKPTRIPAHLPHEATVSIGAVSADDATAVTVGVQPKDT